jgi:hypothetical protein
MTQKSFIGRRSKAVVKSLSLLFALLVVNVLLLAPHWLLAGGWGSGWIALESACVVGLFAIVPRTRWSVPLAGVTAATLVLVSMVGFADTVARQSLGRPLNLYLDLSLASAVYRLLTGVLGLGLGILTLVGIVVSTCLATWLIATLLSSVRPSNWKQLTPTVAVGAIALSIFAFTRGSSYPFEQHIVWPAVRTVADQTRHGLRMLNEQRVFSAEVNAVPSDYANVPGLLDKLRERDVLLAFVESYGVSAIDDPRYSSVLRPRLDDLTRRIADAQLSLATGRLVAPTQGGQSWFSHLSLVSGLWVDNQLRYDLLLASGRETLIDDFHRAGHRTVALMPANTLAWPEGERLGYDEILARRDISYAGPSLNWVTMPDQFTWSFLENNVRGSDRDQRPLFAELGLISSHAPWTPILPVLDNWDSIGDGKIFEPWRDAGERPQDLWRDKERVRKHFALSLDYAINVVTGYAERYVDDQTLLIVLGDHQPAPLITGDDASRAVPVHIISGDPTLIEPFLHWGFVTGALPDTTRPTLGMDAFRDWFVRAFSTPIDKSAP